MVTLSDILKAGSLELTINQVINEIPLMVRRSRDPIAKKYFMYKTEEDFVLGWILGRIEAQCQYILSGFGGWRNLGPADHQEIFNLVHSKMPQIRNKIYETG
ncbi:MAG: hypothetical protein M3P08_11850 [Thermoproteota archaeon]|nr:hypothetical protein [Thermoproteota archaeon]